MPKLKRKSMVSDCARDNIEDIQKYYNSNNEDSRLDTQQLEFLVSVLVLQNYIRPNSSILELGCGSGKYTKLFVEEGHKITAVDFSEKLIQTARNRFQQSKGIKNVEFMVADARDIVERLKGQKFDCILIMGPMYHLVELTERRQMISNAAELVVSGGHVISAHTHRLGIFMHEIIKNPQWIVEQRNVVESFWRTGTIMDHPKHGVYRGYWTRFQEVRELYEKAGLQWQAFHVQDPCIGAADEIFNRLSADQKMAWADFFFSVSSDAEMLGAGRHFLCVGKGP